MMCNYKRIELWHGHCSIVCMTKQNVLKALDQVESSGNGFWSKGIGNTINIFVRAHKHNCDVQWPNARAIEKHFGMMVRSTEVDKISGHVVVTIKGFYKG